MIDYVPTKKGFTTALKGWLFAHEFVRPAVYMAERIDLYEVKTGWLWWRRVVRIEVPKVCVAVVTTLPLSFQDQERLERFARDIKPAGVPVIFDYYHE